MLAAMAMTLCAPLLAHAAGDPKAGENKNSMCVGCHGVDGYKTAFPDVYHVPKIGGQHAEYLALALKAYKAGQRKHPSMLGIAAQLSDKDIEDLAAYYASRKPQ
ncbi:cytochrome c [Chitinimonas sp. DQS-5]|uniref:Cytochrome c n=2 Tax=Parachitinimonas caeni TaxID=3031301 RepID=A0ABT7DSJ2_9NEIS|nr:cytochrome c [Parachitinimonas caeni]